MTRRGVSFDRRRPGRPRGGSARRARGRATPASPARGRARCGSRLPSTDEHEVAGLQPGLGGRRGRGRPTRSPGAASCQAGTSHADHERHGDEEDGARRRWPTGPATRIGGPLPARQQRLAAGLGADDVGLVGPEAVDPDVAAERDQADAVVGLAALEAEQPLAEAEREDADPARRRRAPRGSGRPRGGRPGPRGRRSVTAR